jgi:4-hydroxy-tetrahydrodipicolinate reductase
MITAIVIGAAGRMGQRLVSAVAQAQDFKLVGAVEKPEHPELGKDAGVVAGIGKIGISISSRLEPLLKDAQVILDFTAPVATLSHLEMAAAHDVAVVIGTTGLASQERERIKSYASKIPILLAPNMSTGVNLMFYLVKKAAQVLGEDFDLEVMEIHHRLKKDAPSGTALRLAEVLADARGLRVEEAARYHRQGMIGERDKKEVGIQTLRAGDIVGEHTVLMAGPGERLEIIHRAHSRDTFAHGALRAARWLVKQKPGLYTMQEFLGLV